MTLRKRITHKHAMAGLTVALLCAIASLGATVASGASFVVDNLGDSSSTGGCLTGPTDCSLRQALATANVGATPDTISFASGFTISIASPLPQILFPVSINALSTGAKVVGTYPACGPTYALGVTLGPTTAGTSIRHLPISAVCGFSIGSTVSPPSNLRVGPRLYDGTLPVSGNAEGAVDIFTAASVGSDNEATAWLGETATSAGAFSFLPSPELVSGAAITATLTDATATSNFAARTIVPSDIVSPTLVRAVGVSSSRVRLDFSEPIGAASVAPSDFVLSVGDLPRIVAGASVVGNSIYLDALTPWFYGEAGSVSFASLGAVTDEAGNQLLNNPSTRVLASPGDLEDPQISLMSVSPNKFCRFVSRSCKKSKASIKLKLSEKARVRFTIMRFGKGNKTVAAFKKRLDAGRSSVELKTFVSGHQLTHGKYVLQAVAVDSAKNSGLPVVAYFQIG